MINCIFVRSRKDMMERAATLTFPSILISIRDVGAEPITLANNKNLIAVLNLEFEDWDVENAGCKVISNEDAKAIAEFVMLYQNKPEEYDLYVNCEAGMSRSAGVAASISKALFDDDEIFFRIKYPNMLCYRKVYEALMEVMV